jgi:hypothetical protein
VKNLRSVLMSELEAALSQQVGISTIGGCGEEPKECSHVRTRGCTLTIGWYFNHWRMW